MILKSNKDKLNSHEDRISALESAPVFDPAEIETSVQQNLTDIQLIKSSHEELKKQLADCTAIISDQDEQIEDLRNRQMRKTLVFKGVKESETEKTWDDTEETLLEVIKQVEPDFPEDRIEHCHRAQRRTFSRTGSRDIVAQLYSWKDAETVRRAFAKKNSKDRKFGVFCGQKYGPLTTARQNLAMKLRRDLITSGEYAKAYVAYPAKLMGAKEKRDTTYKLHTNFSSHVVSKKGEIATDSMHA